MKKIYTINGSVKIPKSNGSISSYIFNGDIEEEHGRELYIIDTIEGEKSEYVDNMPKIAQEYINKNK